MGNYILFKQFILDATNQRTGNNMNNLFDYLEWAVAQQGDWDVVTWAKEATDEKTWSMFLSKDHDKSGKYACIEFYRHSSYNIIIGRSYFTVNAAKRDQILNSSTKTRAYLTSTLGLDRTNTSTSVTLGVTTFSSSESDGYQYYIFSPTIYSIYVGPDVIMVIPEDKIWSNKFITNIFFKERTSTYGGVLLSGLYANSERPTLNNDSSLTNVYVSFLTFAMISGGASSGSVSGSVKYFFNLLSSNITNKDFMQIAYYKPSFIIHNTSSSNFQEIFNTDFIIFSHLNFGYPKILVEEKKFLKLGTVNTVFTSNSAYQTGDRYCNVYLKVDELYNGTSKDSSF